jgi:tRNA(Ile)-lysidine synthase
MILRILRYISPQPWGSARAQARRSRLRIDKIVERVWHPSPLTARGMRPFASGSGVLWFPVLVDPSRNAANCLAVGGRIKRPNVDDILSNEAVFGRGIVGWIASRQPPLTHAKQAALGLKDTLNVDITETLRDALVAWDQGKGAGPPVIQVLWDCRFLLSFDLASMPQRLCQELSTPTPSSSIKIAIRWWTRYYLPKVVIVPPNGRTAWSEKEGRREVLLHSDIRTNVNSVVLQSRPKSLGKFMNQANRKEDVIVGNTSILQSDWINSDWIRLLDSF